MSPEASWSGSPKPIPIQERVEVIDVSGTHTLVSMSDIEALLELQKTQKEGETLLLKSDKNGVVYRNNIEVATTAVSGTISFVV